MKKPVNKDIQQLLKVRKMRLEGLQTAHRRLEDARDEAERTIQQNHQALADTQVKVKQREDEQLKALISQQAVRGHHVVKFTKTQLNGIRRILNAEEKIHSAIHEHERCQNQCAESFTKLKQAEKNIIKLEEMNTLLRSNRP